MRLAAALLGVHGICDLVTGSNRDETVICLVAGWIRQDPTMGVLNLLHHYNFLEVLHVNVCTYRAIVGAQLRIVSYRLSVVQTRQHSKA